MGRVACGCAPKKERDKAATAYCCCYHGRAGQAGRAGASPGWVRHGRDGMAGLSMAMGVGGCYQLPCRSWVGAVWCSADHVPDLACSRPPFHSSTLASICAVSALLCSFPADCALSRLVHAPPSTATPGPATPAHPSTSSLRPRTRLQSPRVVVWGRPGHTS
jgi:hypothetical protein